MTCPTPSRIEGIAKLIDEESGEVDVNRAGGWSREQVVRMDARFVAAVQRAKANKESNHDQRTRRAARAH